MLVAHDRWFLEAVGTSVLELEAGRGRFFAGTWHAWRREKAARELALGRAIERQEAEIERLERFVTRFRAGTRARQAQSRAKKLGEDGADQPLAPRDGAAMQFAFKPPERSGRVVFELADGSIFGGRQAAARRRRAVARARRARVAGRTQRRRQDDADRDARRASASSTPASCSPATTSRSATSPSTPRSFEAAMPGRCWRPLSTRPDSPRSKARALLGRFLFSGEDAEKPLDGLSGGERRRLSLAILVHSGANVLILDEPTNHLDIESREALEQALSEFAGSLLLVTHDRALLDAVGTRTIAFEDGTLHSYVGGWPEYVRVREERAAARVSPKPPAPRRSGPSASSRDGARAAAPARRSLSSRSRRPRHPCGRSRTNSPTRERGQRRRRALPRARVTSRRNAP